MSDKSEFSNCEDEKLTSTAQDASYPKTIIIPTQYNSDSDEENLMTFRRRVSSSEGSEGDEAFDQFDTSYSTRPTHLLKRARRQAKEFNKKGELEQAVKERVKSLAYTRLVYGDGHWQMAKAYGKLGEAYLKRKGYCKQALLHATRGRDELLLGESAEYRSNRLSHSNDVLGVMEMVYYVMGKAHFLLGELRKAEQALKKAEISSMERLKFEEGKISELYVKILECLGQVYVKLKKCDVGIEYYEKALKQARKIHGKMGAELIPLCLGLGKAYHRQQGDLSDRKCVEILEKCYQLAKQNFSEGSVELADVMYSIAAGCQDSDAFDGSDHIKKQLKDCLQIYKDQYGPDNKKTIKVQEELCSLLVRSGEQEAAAAIIQDVIASKMMVYGDPSVSLAESYQLLGTIRLSQGKTEKAIKHFSKCHSMLLCVLGSNHKKTIQVTETLNMLKRTAGTKFQSSSEKLKERPRFNGTVGRSSSLRTSTPLSSF